MLKFLANKVPARYRGALSEAFRQDRIAQLERRVVIDAWRPIKKRLARWSQPEQEAMLAGYPVVRV